MLLYLYLYCIKIFFFPTVFDCSFTFCLACLCGCNYGFCLYWTGMSLSSFFKKMLFYVLSNHKVKFFLSRHKTMSLLHTKNLQFYCALFSLLLLNYLRSLLAAPYLFLDTMEQERMPRTAGLSLSYNRVV